ncbi:MAG: R body protein [Proteobacteria bacterium]|nr:R body protein [Pseudomonadota bacterium]
MLSNLAYSNVISSNDLSTKNLVSNQDAQNKLRLLILSKAVNQIQNNQPLQARSAMDMLTNNELAQTVTDLKAIVTTFADKKTES